MGEFATKTPAKMERKLSERMSALQSWNPLENLRREIDRMLEDFDRGLSRFPLRRSVFDIEPFWRREVSWGGTPAVDIIENDDAYKVMAELPGMDEKDIEVKLVNGSLTIKGEKQEEKEEKKKDFYLHERHFGSFERRFAVPESVDADKIDANLEKGVLTLTLPKKPGAQQPEKKIEVKVA